MDFEGKIALVTGAAVGIGRATALGLAAGGAKLVLIDVDEEKLLMLKKEIEAYTKDVLAIQCDISDEAGVNAAAAEALEKFDRVDILVNNAALWREFKPFVDSDMNIWKRFFNINVTGTAYVTKAVLPKMIENEYGRIINVASVAGVYGNGNMACYSATKGAIIAFTRALAKEVAKKGVTVNAVSPGSVSPSDQMDIDFTQPSELSFMGRTGTDRENADLICFLASDQAGYISGQNIQIDGCRKKM